MTLKLAQYDLPWTGHNIQKAKAPGAFIVSWLGVTEADTCEPVFHPDYSEKSIHVILVSGSGLDLDITGSNKLDGSNGVVLKNGSGADLTFTGTGLDYIQSNVGCIIPVINAGTTVVVDIHMLITTIARRQ